MTRYYARHLPRGRHALERVGCFQLLPERLMSIHEYPPRKVETGEPKPEKYVLIIKDLLASFRKLSSFEPGAG